jgi:hypothetical protein
LIEPRLALKAQATDTFQHAQRPKRIGFYRVFRLLKRHRYVALGRKIINLIGLDELYGVFQTAVIGHITVMEKKTAAFGVWVLNEMIDPAGIE